MTADKRGPAMQEELSRLFGGYRAEWLGEMVFDLFTAPDYLPELLTDRPCLLFGGRGTGKTTVLRGLSYEGRARLSDVESPQQWPYFGFYLRINTNRVTAFQGPELPPERWTKCFSHYLNLLLCGEVLRFCDWFQARTGSALAVSGQELGLVAASFNLPPVDSLQQLRLALSVTRVRFEAYINNVVDGDVPALTLLGAPIDQLLEMLHHAPAFGGKLFFFLIDEYENLADYQQEVMNTLIKHSGSLYTFKVGIKELGLRRRSTLNSHEQLISPADYERIDITARLQQEGFSDFAARVCNDRLRRLHFVEQSDAVDVRRILPGFTEVEEAFALGIESHVRDLRARLRPEASDEELVGFDGLSPLEAYLVAFWAAAQGRPALEILREALALPSAWKARLENYQYAMLFTLRRRKRGVHKYYCGWDTYAIMANGNIRYLLQLVAEALLRQHDKAGDVGRVDQVEQTLAAQEVGRKNLTELEGLAVNGAQLTRLVLGLGRVFQVMARQAEGHTPETTQFFLADGNYSLQPDEQPVEPVHARAREILTAGIMHQALVRSVANKLPASSGDTKDYDYSLHPIFSAFFEYSHRRKRRMQLSSVDLVGLVESPRSTIAQVLDRSGRLSAEDLPEQLELFAAYFHAVP